MESVKASEISIVFIMDNVCMLIPTVAFDEGISCTGQKAQYSKLNF